MLRTLTIAAVLLAAVPAAADPWRGEGYGFGRRDPNDVYGGYNRYCPPGQIPQSFPNGNGVRCVLPDGDWR
jgi:hypothetical protein